jgi:uncharacterized repeat protein (TIGR01451 family)
MFRKLISNLPYSPALVGQLGFYAKRLRKEEATRRLGLIFTALALIVQSFAVFQAPEAANASNPSNFVNGGVSSIGEYLGYYDRNHRNMKDLYSSLGITRAEIKNLKSATFNSKKDGVYSWGMTSRFSHAQGERKYTFPTSDGGNATVFYRPLTLWDSLPYTIANGSTYHGWVGYSKKFGWFGVMKDCGNLITKKSPPPPPQPAAFCDGLTITRLDRTRFRLDAKASTRDGARITGYSFWAKNSSGTVVWRDNVNTNNTTTRTEITREQTGTYQARVIVHTSVGDRTDNGCLGKFTVAPPPSQPSVSIDKKVDGVEHKTVGLNTNFTYQIAVKNTGNVALQNVVVTDKQPAGVTFVSASAGQIQNNTWKHTVNLAIGETKTFTITAKVPTYKAGTIRNTACVDAPAVPGTPDDCDDATVDVPVPPEPVAACTAVKAEISNRTIVSLSGQATAQNGATVKEYVFTVKDKSGATIKEVRVVSDKLSVAADNFNLGTPGDYTVLLTVKTSLGDRTDPEDCATAFTIVKPEVCQYNPSLSPGDPRCQPCPDPNQPNLWIESPDCEAEVVQSKTAINLDEGNGVAAALTAKTSQRISYTITVKNKGYVSTTVPLEEKLDDVLEYATLVDAGGGVLNAETKTLTWPAVELKPGEEQIRTFVVRTLDTIPATNVGTSDASSYNCVMTNTFGNSIDIAVDCPTPKVVENVVRELPKTGPRENILFAGLVATIVVYFYARSRQTNKELRLIRRELHAGTI